MYMIMFVLDDPDRLDEVLDAWEQAGTQGATIIESTGINRYRGRSLPMRYVFTTPRRQEEGHITLFAIVSSLEVAQACLQATEALVGDLNLPNNGVIAIWPLAIVKGVPAEEGGETNL